MKQLICEEPDTRRNALVDSQVAKGAVAKGRSSARSLQGGHEEDDCLTVGRRLESSHELCANQTQSTQPMHQR